MRLLGIDFTSAPRRSKPIVCATCQLTDSDSLLRVETLQLLESLSEFEDLLNRPGPWLAAVDFPLGQPRRLVEALKWPDRWEKYVRCIGRLTKQQFVDTLDAYRSGQPPGDKHHLRDADRIASACSPMMLYGVPVGKMFFEGAPRVERSGACVPPCRINASRRVVVEAYPALLARQLIGKESYKTEQTSRANETRAPRQRLVKALIDASRRRSDWPEVQLARGIKAELNRDFRGDGIDAVLCAIQAAWCYRQREHGFGIPSEADPLEGWIAGCEVNSPPSNDAGVDR